MKDWNKMTIDEHIEHLESKFQFDSSGTAKSVFEVIKRIKELEEALSDALGDDPEWQKQLKFSEFQRLRYILTKK